MRGRRLDLVVSGPASSAANMALDEALLELGRGLTLRLYQWRPFALSLGWFQSAPDEARERELAREGIDLVRRLTGGGAILHAHELTYALTGDEGAAPFDGAVDDSYRLVHDALLAVFADLGVAAGYPAEAPTSLRRSEQPFLCFARSTALDLVSDGRKLVGSAKRRRDGRALQHGSILLRPHPLQPATASLEELAGTPIDIDRLGLAFATRLADALELDLEPTGPAQDVAARAEDLAERYSDPAWTRQPREAGAER